MTAFFCLDFLNPECSDVEFCQTEKFRSTPAASDPFLNSILLVLVSRLSAPGSETTRKLLV